MEDYLSKINLGLIKLTPRQFLEQVAEELKKAENRPYISPYGKTKAQIMSHIDTLDAIEKYEEGIEPKEYVDEFILGE